jgi:hypothetical protein
MWIQGKTKKMDGGKGKALIISVCIIERIFGRPCYGTRNSLSCLSFHTALHRGIQMALHFFSVASSLRTYREHDGGLRRILFCFFVYSRVHTST